jgi:hypothetical protein
MIAGFVVSHTGAEAVEAINDYLARSGRSDWSVRPNEAWSEHGTVYSADLPRQAGLFRMMLLATFHEIDLT